MGVKRRRVVKGHVVLGEQRLSRPSGAIGYTPHYKPKLEKYPR